MYVEKVGALLDHAEQVANAAVDKYTSSEQLMAKLQASRLIPTLRGALFPEDDDG